VAYFDRATAELADQARRDPLTELLNYAAFGVGVHDFDRRAGIGRRFEANQHAGMQMRGDRFDGNA
jgi:hypothetical protein